MAKYKVKPYHAVYYIATGESEIMTDNERYTAIHRGGGTEYSSFDTVDEAKEWLKKVAEKRGKKTKTKTGRKYYAVYIIDTEERAIYEKWSEAKTVIDKHNDRCLYKSFFDLGTAAEYLNTITQSQIDYVLKRIEERQEVINNTDESQCPF